MTKYGKATQMPNHPPRETHPTPTIGAVKGVIYTSCSSKGTLYWMRPVELDSTTAGGSFQIEPRSISDMNPVPTYLGRYLPVMREKQTFNLLQ